MSEKAGWKKLIPAFLTGIIPAYAVIQVSGIYILQLLHEMVPFSMGRFGISFVWGMSAAVFRAGVHLTFIPTIVYVSILAVLLLMIRSKACFVRWSVLVSMALTAGIYISCYILQSIWDPFYYEITIKDWRLLLALFIASILAGLLGNFCIVGVYCLVFRKRKAEVPEPVPDHLIESEHQ
jgi:hypothetical protein